MAFRTIDGALLRDMALLGAALIEQSRAAIDSLNVFPVPDGDTGTNMSLTMLSATREIRARESAVHDDATLGPLTADIVAEALARGALRGARGNSGVILSQLWRGFGKALEGCAEIDAAALGQALKQGVDTAYKAVMKPREGTILTVARVIAEAVCASEEQDLGKVFDLIMQVGEEALLKTPDQLPVLKQAGVVDAGGKGLLLIYAGFRAAYNGEEVDASALTQALPSQAPADEALETADIHFIYCTEFFITHCFEGVGDKQIDNLRASYARIGDCVLVVGDMDFVKVHVHTNDPGKVLQAALRLGELSSIKIDNMKEQHRSIIEDAPTAPAAAPVPIDKEWGIVAVAAGDGLAALFTDLAAAEIVEGGQTMNPSTDDIAQAISRTGAQKVIVLPNNGNITMAARQAAELFTDRSVAVVPTKSVPQGIGALVAFMATNGMNDNIARMTEAAAAVKTGQVTYAVRDSQWDEGAIAEGDTMGLFNGKIAHVGGDIAEATMALLEKMVDEDDAIITLFYGIDTSEEEAEALSASVAERFGDCDVEMHAGGQPVYYYLISVE